MCLIFDAIRINLLLCFYPTCMLCVLISLYHQVVNHTSSKSIIRKEHIFTVSIDTLYWARILVSSSISKASISKPTINRHLYENAGPVGLMLVQRRRRWTIIYYKVNDSDFPPLFMTYFFALVRVHFLRQCLKTFEESVLFE